MGIISKTFKLAVYGSTAAAGTFFISTRKSHMVDVPANDPIYSLPLYRQLNPHRNPPTQDICVRRVPLGEIKPELLKTHGKLVEAFCAGVWGGIGYATQRAFLSNKYQGPETSDHLWSREELQTSTYPVSTKITDHFEVVEHTDDSIIVRCGDSPRKTGVRESDGLFEMSAKIKHDEGVVEFALKSLLFVGSEKTSAEPMPDWMKWLHQQYAKFWMEFAVNNCTR